MHQFFNRKQFASQQRHCCFTGLVRDNQVRDEMTQHYVARARARAPSIDLTDQYPARRIQRQNWAT